MSNDRNKTLDDICRDLLGLQDDLTQRTQIFEGEIQKQSLIVQNNLQRNQRIAIRALKRKKRLEKQLSQVDGTLTRLEYLIERLKNAAQTFRSANGGWDMRIVTELKEEIANQIKLVNTINDAIVHKDNESDEDELSAELDKLLSDNNRNSSSQVLTRNNRRGFQRNEFDSQRYKKVNEERTSNGNSKLAIGAIGVIAIVIVGLFVVMR